MVLDLHQAVVVDGGVASNDTDDGRGDLLPGVEFFLAAGGGGTKAKEPGTERVNVERLAVEFRLYRRFALTLLAFPFVTDFKSLHSNPTSSTRRRQRQSGDDG